MKDTVYLVVHGFAGGPREVDYLAEFLKAGGLDVYTVLLSGHGGTKKDLSKTGHADWISSVRGAVEAYGKEYRSVVLIGFSMGGLISAQFADVPSVAKLALVNVPVYIWNPRVIFNDVFTAVRHRRYEKMRFYRKAIRGSSLKSNVDFLRILSKRTLNPVQKPVLIVQCVNDETVRPKSALVIQSKLGPCAELRYYEGGCHLIFMEESRVRDDICRDIMKFLTESP